LKRLILASASPRRRRLLQGLGVPFEVIAPRVREPSGQGLRPRALVQRVAALKAHAVARRRRAGVVLAADTTVVLDGHALGKPTNREDARSMLRRLSGRAHVVLTGVHVVDCGSGREAAGLSRTHVWMHPASDARIEAYLRTGEPFDKAGAYAIQGKGGNLVARLSGPYDNVVGLPMHVVRRLLVEVGFAEATRGPRRALGVKQ
jgi:septum formation protein